MFLCTRNSLITDSNVTRTIKKKNKRNRTSFTTEQLKALEKWFSRSKYLDRDRRRELSEVLGLGEKCIKIWFQNRRMKEKKECSESSSDSSSEGNADPVSPLPPMRPETSGTQNTPELFIPNDPVKFSYHVGANEHNVLSHNRYSNYQSITEQHYDNPLPVHYTFNNDTNIYPTQHYPYPQNEYVSTTEPNNEYYGYQLQWPEGAFNIGYL